MEYCLTETQGHTRSVIPIIQAIMGAVLDDANFCLYNTVCDYLKGFPNHDKTMFSTVALNILRMSVRYMFKRASLDQTQNDYFTKC